MSERLLPALRLARVLRRRADAEGSFNKLARKITEASCPRAGAGGSDPPVERRGKDCVDRRKLKRLVEGENVVLSIAELRALDAYLERYNEGLAHRPLFERPSLLEALAAGGEVAFLLGCRPRRGGGGPGASAAPAAYGDAEEISKWDVHSMTDVQAGLLQVAPAVRMDLLDVRREPEPSVARQSIHEPWGAALSGEGPSLVALGSPRTCPAVEHLLARMFGVEAYRGGSAGRSGLPFGFVYPPDLEGSAASSFSCELEAVREQDAELAGQIARGEAAALRLGSRFVRSLVPGGAPPSSGAHGANGSAGSEGWTYAVVAAQRRRTGRVWMALAGLTDCGTLAAARLLPCLSAGRLHSDSGRLSPVLWAGIRARVEVLPAASSRSFRRLVSQEVVEGPFAWGPAPR